MINYIVNKELTKKRGKIFAFFANLKAAFDRVERVKLREMEKIGIGKKLRRRILETYKETKNRVKVRNKFTEEFWTRKGVRQGCPMSTTLFNIYISFHHSFLGSASRDEKGANTEGVTIGKEKLWTTTYADDLVMLAKSE